jgi:hypothetical protein
MAGADRRIALLGLLALALAIGASGLHLHYAPPDSSTNSECAICVLAQTPSTIAPGPAPIAPAEEVGVGFCQTPTLPCDLFHARSDTARGPPHHC